MKAILAVDAVINLALGILLLFFQSVYRFLGVPASSTGFYPNILGAVLIGIAVALAIEVFKREGGTSAGLGLLGAISINLCGGLVLVLWLVFGDLTMPLHGWIFLWVLAAVLVGVSLVELVIDAARGSRAGGAAAR
jgi:hypothetical protein